MSLLDKVSNIASQKQKEDKQSNQNDKGQDLLEQVRKIFLKKFGSKFKRKKLEEIINMANTTEHYQEVINKIGKSSFDDDEFAEIIILLQQHWGQKNLNPEQAELQEVLMKLLQIFIDQMGGEHLATLGKSVGPMFNKRLDQENERLEGQKPMKLLKSIDKNFSMKGTEIEGTFLSESQGE